MARRLMKLLDRLTGHRPDASASGASIPARWPETGARTLMQRTYGQRRRATCSYAADAWPAVLCASHSFQPCL